jgi:hypothetical protein
MGRFIGMVGLCFVATAGCGGPPTRDASEVYEAVLRQSLLTQGEGKGIYVQVDGGDPPAEMLDRLRQQWPALCPVSQSPKGKRLLVHVGELEWIGRSAAEVRGGSNNGMDGVIKRFRVVWSGGRWIVEKTTTEATS